MKHKLAGLGMVAAKHAQKMSITAKVMCGLVVLFYFLGFIPGVKENLAMIPAYFGPPNVKIWTLATATFYESSIILVLLGVTGVVGFSSLLEQLWGPKEFLVFSGLVGVASLTSGMLATVLAYAITQSYSLLLSPFHGLAPLLCGYIVAVKQLHPDSVPLPPPVPPTLRVKHLPTLLVLLALILALLHVVSFPFFWLVLNGNIISWTYLRFYQKKEQGSRGDMSEGFAFATFFPEPIQPLLSTMGGFLFHILVSIKVCPKTVRTYDVSASSTIKLTLPGTDPVDAQRRKQRALKALDERLKKSNEPLSWPSLDEAGTSSQDEAVPPPPSAVASTPQPDAVAVVVEKIPPPTNSDPTSTHEQTKRTETVS